MDSNGDGSAGKCPVMHGEGARTSAGGTSNRDWWPNQLNLGFSISTRACRPDGRGVRLRRGVQEARSGGLKQDLSTLMTDSQDWWPADYGHYGRCSSAWRGTAPAPTASATAAAAPVRHAALRAAQQLARQRQPRQGAPLLWPIKQKYGQKISWADLMVLAGNCAIESMGFKTFGFAGGRADVWEPEEDIYWGPKRRLARRRKRYSGDRDLENPLGAVQMGLIYVNPRGPEREPGSARSAATSARRSRDGHERLRDRCAHRRRPHVRQGHGAARDAARLSVRARGAPARGAGPRLEEQLRSGKGRDTITSGSKAHGPRTRRVGQRLLRRRCSATSGS